MNKKTNTKTKDLPASKVEIVKNSIRFYNPESKKYTYNNLNNFAAWISKVIALRLEALENGDASAVNKKYWYGSALQQDKEVA